jgi:hypothetical protein
MGSLFDGHSVARSVPCNRAVCRLLAHRELGVLARVSMSRGTATAVGSLTSPCDSEIDHTLWT